MLARIRKSAENKDSGFTLIELLVVMIIIGILAAIAIPAFLSQKKKARDTATKADVTTVGKEVATYFVDNTGTLTLSAATGAVVLADGGSFSTTIKTSTGTAVPASGASANLSSPDTWCVALTNPAGADVTWSYSAVNGLKKGGC